MSIISSESCYNPRLVLKYEVCNWSPDELTTCMQSTSVNVPVN